jgi:hypothetical protein
VLGFKVSGVSIQVSALSLTIFQAGNWAIPRWNSRHVKPIKQAANILTEKLKY